MSQRLLPRADGHGRVAAIEVLLANGTARDMIRDKERTPALHDYIKESHEHGMQTFDQHLMDLVADDIVTYETALAASSNPSDFQMQVTFRRRARMVPPTGPSRAQAAEGPPGVSDDLSSMLPS